MAYSLSLKLGEGMRALFIVLKLSHTLIVGKFLWSISDRNLTYMISPELEVNAPSCVTFQYYANTTNRHTFALGIQFILENIDGSFTFPIAWVTVSVTDDKWELGQFDINENHAGIRLMIGNVLGQVGLDNIRVSQGQCKGHSKYEKITENYNSECMQVSVRTEQVSRITYTFIRLSHACTKYMYLFFFYFFNFIKMIFQLIREIVTSLSQLGGGLGTPKQV